MSKIKKGDPILDPKPELTKEMEQTPSECLSNFHFYFSDFCIC